jgi:hypothetical protein
MALLHKLRRNLADLIDPESAHQRAPALATSPTRAVSAELFPAFGLGQAADAVVLPIGGEPSFADAGAAEPSWPAPSRLPPAAPEIDDPLAGLSYSYRPSWDPTRGVIAAYLCMPTLPEASGSARRAPAALVLKHDEAALEKLDFATLSHGIGVVEGFAHERRRLLITVPVRFETLCAAPQHRRYIETLRTRLSPQAASLLVVELVNVPAGVAELQLLDISSPLRAHARAVIARLPPDITDVGRFAAVRIAAVGWDLAEQSASEVALMQQMARFSRGAAKAGIATYLRGIGSLSLAAAALGAGFAHLDGDAVALTVDQPHGVVQFSLLDLYGPPGKG